MNQQYEINSQVARLLDLLRKPYTLQGNTDNHLHYGKGIVAFAKEMLPVTDALSLLYLFDLCKKGYYEHLKERKETAKGYFSKVMAYPGTGSSAAVSHLCHTLLKELFLSYHYSGLGMADKAAETLKRSPEHCKELNEIVNKEFFQQLSVFMWLFGRI
jgi:hypothetical protein